MASIFAHHHLALSHTIIISSETEYRWPALSHGIIMWRPSLPVLATSTNDPLSIGNIYDATPTRESDSRRQSQVETPLSIEPKSCCTPISIIRKSGSWCCNGNLLCTQISLGSCVSVRTQRRQWNPDAGAQSLEIRSGRMLCTLMPLIEIALLAYIAVLVTIPMY